MIWERKGFLAGGLQLAISRNFFYAAINAQGQ